MILSLLLALCAQSPAAPRIADPAEQRTFAAVQAALDADPALLAQHRGFWKYVAADPDLRQAEENYDAAMEISSVRDAVGYLEEGLTADQTLRDEYDLYTARLRRDPQLFEAVSRLVQTEYSQLGSNSDLAGSLQYLRANPDLAVRVLTLHQRPASAEPALTALFDYLRREPNQEAQLGNAWSSVDALAGAREAVYPWWSRVYTTQTAVAQRYRAAETEFARVPALRRAWEAREVAWAGRGDAVRWRNYLYARVRRDRALDGPYFTYLRTLRANPEAALYSEAQFAATHGAPPAWPPLTQPPTLPLWRPAPSITRPESPTSPDRAKQEFESIARPKSPAVNRPTAPAPPAPPKKSN